jgi:hypothetical protein
MHSKIVITKTLQTMNNTFPYVFRQMQIIHWITPSSNAFRTQIC